MNRENKELIILRADGGANIGYGHLMRVLALGSILVKEYNVTLISRNVDNFMKDAFYKKGIDVIDLYSSFMCKEPLLDPGFKKLPIRAIVIDGYEFDYQYQKRLREHGVKVCFIDDFLDKSKCADLILNHAPLIADFMSHEEENYCLGESFTLLREAFYEARNSGRSSERKASIILSFGINDHCDLARKVIEKFEPAWAEKEVTVLIGERSPSFNTLKIASQQKSFLKLQSTLGPEELISKIKKAELIICSASTISIESAFIGAPLIICQTVDNQALIFEGLTRKKMALSFSLNSLDTLENSIAKLNENNVLDEMLQCQAKCYNLDPRAEILNKFKLL